MKWYIIRHGDKEKGDFFNPTLRHQDQPISEKGQIEAKNLRRDLPVEIPEGGCFMLGDNSSTSLDSRAWGAVPASQLIGRPMVVFWPPSRMKVVR